MTGLVKEQPSIPVKVQRWHWLSAGNARALGRLFGRCT